MADNPFEKFGLTPKAGGDAEKFAESMDKSANAAKRFRLESDLGYKTLTNQLDITQKLVDEAKLNQKLIEKKNFDQKSLVVQLRKEGASQKEIAKAVASAKESRDAIKKSTKVIQRNEEKITKLTSEKAELDGVITTEMEKQSKLGNLLNIGLAALVTLGAELLSRQGKVRDEMGLTVAQANKLLPVIQDVSSELADQGINFEKSSAAAQAIYNSSKNLADITEENVANVALVSQKFGIAVADTAAIAQTMKEIGGYSMEQSTNMIAFASAAAEAAGVAPSAVMADIANSAETAAKYFGDNPKALAKAAIEARRLGLTLDDMAGISKGLLDIDSSIQAQFEAQVLTGKQLNFDAARRLALEGDIEGATKSILGQMGSIDEFNKMDVIQKEAVAAAAGLTVTQLSTALTKQKGLNDFTTEQKAEYDKLLASMDQGNKSDAEKLLNETKSLALQQEFNATIDQLKEVLMNDIMPAFEYMIEPITNTIKGIKEWVGGAENLARIIGGIAISFGVIKGISLAMKGFAAADIAYQTLKASIMGTQAIAATTTASALTVGLGTVAIVAGVAAVLAGIAGYSFATADDMVSPGYGERVLSSPEGNIALNNKDTIVAGTNLGGGGSNRELIAKIDELITVVKTAKPINIDGNKVGQAIYLGSIQSGAA